MERLLQDIVNGFSAGSLYALLAVGIVLVYKSSDVLNFAHGSFAMVSTFVAYHVSTKLGLGFGPAPSRIVGQVMEWRGRQKSADTSRMQRRFFSFLTDDALGWHDLPVAGVGDAPAGSLDELLAWLGEVRSERPDREGVIEERQSAWSSLTPC